MSDTSPKDAVKAVAVLRAKIAALPNVAVCNWTCERASRCHEYECDGESHFVPNANHRLLAEE